MFKTGLLAVVLMAVFLGAGWASWTGVGVNQPKLEPKPNIAKQSVSSYHRNRRTGGWFFFFGSRSDSVRGGSTHRRSFSWGGGK